MRRECQVSDPHVNFPQVRDTKCRGYWWKMNGGSWMGDLRPGIPGILVFQGLAMAGVFNRKAIKAILEPRRGQRNPAGARRVNPQMTERFMALMSFTASLQSGPCP